MKYLLVLQTSHNYLTPRKAYDYLALVPSLLVAAAPLILAWFNRKKKESR